MSSTPIVKNQQRILFVSHEATRTGAPLVLFNFLDWLKSTNKYQIFILLKAGGPLTDSFKAIGASYLPAQPGFIRRSAKKVISKLVTLKTKYALPAGLKQQKFDLIYLNTVVSLPLVSDLKAKFNCPVICHVHENDFTIQNYFPECMDRVYLDAVSHFIAVSTSTRNNLIAKYHIPADQISLVNELIPINKIKIPAIAPEKIRQELGLTNEFIIGGSGLTSWRKGIDLFVQLAATLNVIAPQSNIKLLWVGAVSHEFKCQFDYEAERLGITGKVIFTGVKSEPQNYFQLFDVFTLTSREDPFPLVALEAAVLKKPVICFEGSGGIPELISDDETGAVIPYGRVDLMAAKIVSLSEQRDRLAKMGKAAAALVEKFDVSIIGKQLVDVIENNLI